MVAQQVMGLLTDVREMKEKIKETKKEQAHMDAQLRQTLLQIIYVLYILLGLLL